MHVFRIVKRWFSLQGTVGRKEYLLTGVGLMILKYVVEASLVGYITGKFYSPIAFFHPLLSVRASYLQGAPSWLGITLVLWTLVFVWIAVTMSVRRAMDAGASPWAGMLVLIPFFNYITMFCLAGVPANSADRRFNEPSRTPTTEGSLQSLRATLGGIAVGVMYFVVSALLTVNTLGSYGAALFFGTPIVVGAVSAYIFNSPRERSLGATLGHCMIVIASLAGALLLFGMEGAICIVMALPIIAVAALIGALVGRAIAVDKSHNSQKARNGLAGCLIAVPLLAGVEPFVAPNPSMEIQSYVEIDASPERVWQCVVDFPEITAKPEWLFRLGIACPQRARIEGQGVGAVRHCEFSTGSFVEPITVWDAPRRLAFDVTEQPEPMFELTPYRHIHPPHLKGSFRSTRGEFRLVELADGRTRLEGSTWYELKIYPHAYWTLWTDWLLHRIHDRVLRHIQRIAEQ